MANLRRPWRQGSIHGLRKGCNGCLRVAGTLLKAGMRMTNSLRKTMRWLFCLLPIHAFAGQSLVLTPGMASTAMIDPNLSANQDWRVEFQLHNWAAPSVNTTGGFIWDLSGIGSNAAIVPGNLLWINDKRDSIAGGSPCQLPLAGRTDVLVRAQRESSQSRFVCEIWNIDGTNYS